MISMDLLVENATEIVLALITGVFGIWKLYFSRKSKEILPSEIRHTEKDEVIGLMGEISDLKHQIETLENEMKFQNSALSMARYTGKWEQIRYLVNALMKETEIDRFLMLVAWNGRRKPERVSATVQLRADGQGMSQYINNKIDDEYRNMLLEVEDKENVLFTVKNERVGSFLRNAYENEGVLQSLVCFVGSADFPSGSREIDFCSFATHEEKEISKETIRQCMNIVYQLQGIFDTTKPEKHWSEI